MKYVLVIGDGMADNAVASLGGKTPLEYAQIPVMDALASAGVLGSVRTVPPGLPAGSDTAILSIFGCDPRKYYTGRAPLEAAAGGVSLNPGDAAFRCNMVALEDSGGPFKEKRIISHSAGSIEGEESLAIIGALMENETFARLLEEAGMTIYPSPSFRHFAVRRKADIRELETFPPHDHLGEKLGPLLPVGGESGPTLRDLMETAHTILDKHSLNEKRRAAGKLPANGVWFWAEGTAVALPQFTEAYGKTGGVVSAVPLCHGIAALTGLEMIRVEGATGELDTNYEGKVAAALEALKRHDFAAIHVEAPDECTHDGDLTGKLQAIEWLDSRVIGPLAEGLRRAGTPFRLLLLSDHKTLTATRGHDGDPVPFVIYDSREDRATGLRYSEADGERGLIVDDGVGLMDMLFER